MATYILRKLDDDLWGRVKAAAGRQPRMSLRSQLVRVLELYAAGHIEVSPDGGFSLITVRTVPSADRVPR